MNQQEIEGRLKEIAVKVCDKLEDVEIDTALELAKQGMDSLDVLDYVFAVETEFSISVDNDSFDDAGLGKISSMTEFLMSRGV